MTPSLAKSIARITPRHLVSISQLSSAELSALVSKAQHYKEIVKSNDRRRCLENHHKLLGRLVALVFSKRSTRTRISSEGAAAHFGAQPMFLGKDDIQMGVNESVYDTTRVILSMTACIFARVNEHREIQQLCKHLTVPVINSLCDRYHPLQAITDIMSIKEAFGRTQGLKLAWVGDANNVINDLAVAALKLGINVSILVPKGVEFDAEVKHTAQGIARDSHLRFELGHDPLEALRHANVIVTDTWVSMGQEAEKAQKLRQFAGYQVTLDMLERGQVSPDWRFMHCLPRHAEEVAEEVFYHDKSIVFDEAENRLYAAMAAIDGFVLNHGHLES